MKRIIGFFAGLAIVFSGMTVISLSAEEQIHNFEYYWNADDYSVYKEYMNLYEEEKAAATLPKERDLPHFQEAKFYFTDGSGNSIESFPFNVEMKEPHLTDMELSELMKTPSYFGFPDEWYMPDGKKGFESVLRSFPGVSGHNNIGFDFYFLNINGVTKNYPVIRSTLDIYRLQLTIEHSDFAKDYVKYDDIRGNYRVRLRNNPAEGFYLYGDVNEDGIANASDAAVVLIEAAKIGAGNIISFTDLQQSAADVDQDKSITASDATIILQYAATVGSGNRYAKFRDFLNIDDPL